MAEDFRQVLANEGFGGFDQQGQEFAGVGMEQQGQEQEQEQEQEEEEEQKRLAEYYDPEDFNPTLESLKTANEFIALLRQASLDNPLQTLPPGVLEHIKNPERRGINLTPDERASLDFYLSDNPKSERSYKLECMGLVRRCPEARPLSFHLVKKLVADLTGVFEILTDMCVKSCLAFTGVYAYDVKCRECNEDRYVIIKGKKVPRKQSTTILLAPLMQALYSTPEGADNMEYLYKAIRTHIAEVEQYGEKISPYRDVSDGSDLLMR